MRAHIGTRALVCAIGVLLTILFVVIFATPDVAHAVLPQKYVEDVADKEIESPDDAMYGYMRDWWKAGDQLDVSTVQKIVSGWFSSELYDFTELENNPVVVAVIDSGVNVSHEIFSGKYDENGAKTDVAVGQYDVLARNSRGTVVARNTLTGGSDVTDDAPNRHGTHVAGIVALLIHMLDLEKYIKIMPIKAGKPSGTGAKFEATDVKEAIEFALSNGADVINMSLEATEKSFDLVTDEWADRAVFVAAAGNGNSRKIGVDSAESKCYPAAGDNVIGVMNYMPNIKDGEGIMLRESSNYGPAYDLCAPGSEFFSADGRTEDAYKQLSGTSMATPVVSFAAALATLKYRAIEEATGAEETYSPRDIADIVKNSYSSTITVESRKSGTTYELKALDLREVAVNANDEVYAKIVFEEQDQKYQSKGHVTAAKMSLEVMPSARQGEGSVKWYFEDTEGTRTPIGEGYDAQYVPTDGVGESVIYAVWTVDTDSGEHTVTVRTKIYVDYFRVSKANVSEIKVGALTDDGKVGALPKMKAGKTYRLSFAEHDNLSPGVAASAKWYVDGKLVATGEFFDYTPDKEGVKTVYVKFNDLQSPVVELMTVNEDIEKNATVRYVSYALIGVIVAGAAAVAIVLIVKHRRAKREN